MTDIIEEIRATFYEELKLIMDYSKMIKEHRRLKNDQARYKNALKEAFSYYYKDKLEEVESKLNEIKPKISGFHKKLDEIRNKRRKLMEKMRSLKITPEDECWLCLRIAPQAVFEVTHALFSDENVAHKIAVGALKTIKEAYLKDPYAITGKRPTVLIAGAIYLQCILNNVRTSQRAIGNLLGVSETSIKNTYRRFAKILEIKWEEEEKEYAEEDLDLIREIIRRLLYG